MSNPFWSLSCGLTSYHLKLLAAATMMIDHIGVVFYPDMIWFRIIGRISFPLFIWLLVKGEAHTKDVWQYGLRLGALGVVSQPLYQIVLGADRPNILFQLLLGLICLRLVRNFPHFSLGVWLLGASIAWLTDLSYDAYGVALICMIRYFQPTVLWWIVWAAFHGIWAWLGGPFQLPVIVVPIFFWLANGQRGRRARWFYGFYPGHLALLWLAQYLKTAWELG
jgi:hypothetical protein